MLTAAALAGCTKAASPPGSGGGERHNGTTIAHVLRIGDTADVTTLNPALSATLSLHNIAQMTLAWLVRYDAHNRPMPELALAVPTEANGGISRDGRSITWHLRRGVRWADGVPFNADDVVFSTHAILNRANNVVTRDGWNLIDRVDEPDKFTVVYHLKRRFASFLPTFFGSAGANPCLLPRHLLGTYANINNVAYNALPVGIGPFKITRWVRGDRVEMVPNPRYWRGTPKLQKVVYKFLPDLNTTLTQLKTGEIDLWPFLSSGYYDRVREIKTLRTVRQPGFIYQHMDFNVTRPALRELAVRQALEMALNRPLLRHVVNHDTGTVQEGIEPSVTPWYDPSLRLVPFDLAAANRKLDAAGWKRGSDGVRAKNGVRLELEFAAYTGNVTLDTIVELIRGWWTPIGVGINVHRYSYPLLLAPLQDGGILYSGKFDVTVILWQLTPTGDLSNLLECAQIPPNGQNLMRYCDAETDRALEAVKGAYDERVRARYVQAVQRSVAHNVPTIVIFLRDNINTYNTDLRNWHPNQLTLFDDMLNVDI